MSQPEDHVFGNGRRVYRRKRKYQGATWTPPSMSSDVEDGLWCKACHKRHGYMVLGLKYEKDSKGCWVMIWYCRTTGNVVGQKTLPARPAVTEPTEKESANDDSNS